MRKNSGWRLSEVRNVHRWLSKVVLVWADGVGGGVYWCDLTIRNEER